MVYFEFLNLIRQNLHESNKKSPQTYLFYYPFFITMVLDLIFLLFQWLLGEDFHIQTKNFHLFSLIVDLSIYKCNFMLDYIFCLLYSCIVFWLFFHIFNYNSFHFSHEILNISIFSLNWHTFRRNVLLWFSYLIFM
jgi:hypothetical protein